MCEQLTQIIRYPHSLCCSSEERVIRLKLARSLDAAEFHQAQQAQSTFLKGYFALQTLADIIHHILSIHIRHLGVEMA